MPALNFQARFAPLVESGEKCQTIRKCRTDGRDPKPGDMLYLYTGQRTSRCRKLGEGKCISVQPIEITDLGILLDSRTLSCDNRDRIAVADGFRNEWHLMEWFRETHGLPFEGLLIRWEKP